MLSKICCFFLWAVQVNIKTKCQVKYVGLSVGGSSNMTTKFQAKYVSFSVGCSSEHHHKVSSKLCWFFCGQFK